MGLFCRSFSTCVGNTLTMPVFNIYSSVAVCCSVLQCVAVCCSVLQLKLCSTYIAVLQYTVNDMQKHIEVYFFTTHGRCQCDTCVAYFSAATHCNTLQHTATHCNTLQHTATHCIALHRTAIHCNTLTHVWRISVLQHTATRCIALQHAATH